MPVSQGFVDFVVEQLERCGAITTKRMFGGVGIYSGDVFFAIVANDVLYLKVDDTTRGDFERAGSGPFKPYGDGRETMQYYEVPVSTLEDSDALTVWGKRAIAVAVRAKNTKRTSARRVRSTRTDLYRSIRRKK
jgi:DNA transformation protein